jgi:hypothetical protein
MNDGPLTSRSAGRLVSLLSGGTRYVSFASDEEEPRVRARYTGGMWDRPGRINQRIPLAPQAVRSANARPAGLSGVIPSFGHVIADREIVVGASRRIR